MEGIMKRVVPGDDSRKHTIPCAEIKQKLQHNTQRTIDSGAFGLPWMLVTTDLKKPPEVLFGSDRFAHLATILANNGLKFLQSRKALSEATTRKFALEEVTKRSLKDQHARFSIHISACLRDDILRDRIKGGRIRISFALNENSSGTQTMVLP